MSDQRIPSQWQLQNTGESLEQWMLHEEEQSLPSHLQLNPQQGAPNDPYAAHYQADPQGQYPPQYGNQQQYGQQQYGQQQYGQQPDAWQPIDYRAMQQVAQRPANRSGAILGTLLVLALLGVGGYLAWFYAGQPDLFGLTAGTPTEQLAGLPVETPVAAEEPTNEAVAPVAVVETPTTAPTPTIAPTPYLVEISRVTVNSQFGVNARETASADAPLIQLLENGTSFLVANGPVVAADASQWYEIVLPDNERAFVISEFVTPVSEFVPYADAAAILSAANLPVPAAPVVAGSEAITGTAAITDTRAVTTAVTTTTTAGALAGSGTVTDTGAMTDTATIESPAVVTASVITVSAAISAPAGVNLRSAAQTGDNVLQMLVDLTAVAIIGRSTDGAWVQVQIPDGTRGWVSADFVVPTAGANVDAIPLGTTQPLTATDPLLPIAPPVTVAPTTGLTTTAPVTPTAPISGSAGVTPTTGATGTGLGVLGLPTATPSASATVAATEAATTTVGAGLPTATPSAPAAATPEPAPAAGATAIVISYSGANLRPLPAVDSVSTTALDWNTEHTAIARTADNAWVQIQDADGTTGWVTAATVMVMGGVGILPVGQ